MEVILDTNALSSLLDGDKSIEDIISSANQICLPVIVVGEFGYGIKRSIHRKFYEEWLEKNLDSFEVLDVKLGTAKMYSKLRLNLKKNGTPIPENDIWIAALAIERNLPILTRDRHFRSVKGLEVVDW